MTRKDYVLLANALKRATPLARDGKVAEIQWRHCVNCVTTALEADNPRFDRKRFIAACEGT